MIGKKVLVTTLHRGVFFGTLVERNGDTVTLTDCRNCIYWDSSVKGFLGLSANGPSKKSRVGPSSPRIELSGVTSVSECTDEAIARWEAAPWS